MSDCSSCPSHGTCGKDSSSCGVNLKEGNKGIKNVIGVMSGKGGVGKSTVSVMLSKQLKEKGYKVGVLDADITGPSICRMLNIPKGSRAYANEDGIVPVENEDGIKMMSLNLMLDDENQPVIWRGSMLSSAVTQFWNDVNWGELDYLIIDMPPGTGDITLTVMQTIPLTGVVIVSIPQDMVSMIVTKSINMTKKLNIPILGIIQNMSYMVCPHCGEQIMLHSMEASESFIKLNEIELLGKLPTTKSICDISEQGFKLLEDDIVRNISDITDKVINKIKA